MISVIQKAQAALAGGTTSPITATFASPPTAGNQIIAVHDYSFGSSGPTWPFGFVEQPIIDQATGLPPVIQATYIATKTAGVGESSSVTATLTGGDRAILMIFEVPPNTFNGAIWHDELTSTSHDLATVTPIGDEFLLLAMIYAAQGFPVTVHPTGWTAEQDTIANTGSNSTTGYAYSKVVAPPSGSYTGTVTYSSGTGSHAVTMMLEATASAEPDPGPEPPVVYDPDDVLLATLTEAFDIKIRIELNGTGSGQFSINRHSADALAAALKPGNYVRVAIPQIDPDAIFGFFLEGGTVKVVSADEEGGEIVTFGGRGGLAYWDRAIWLNESFLLSWVPAWIEAAHGAPPAGTLGAVHYAAGTYTRYTFTNRLITSRTTFSTGGFSSYYDQRVRVHDSNGNYTTLIHLTTGGVAGWWVKPYGPGVTEYKAQSQYVFGPSIAMESITANRTPGEVIYVMYQEATDPARPIAPLPLMTVDFDDTLDSDGNAWTVTDGVNGISADLGEDYLSTIGKLTNLGVVDVVMGPNFDMHAYNAYGRDLHSSTYASGKVRFEKAVNIADELSREYSDSPVGTFAEVLGSQDGVIARVELADAASRTPREISVRGDSDDVDALEALGLSELEARLLHSDAIGFNVATPIIGQENELTGLYLPGPPGSANGNYWVGDLVTLHTGTGQHDFDEETVRIAAITIQFSEANSMLVTVEVNSGFGGYQPNGGSTGQSTSTTGQGTAGTLSDLYQLVSERDNAMGYAGLDDNALVPFDELPTQWKQSVRVATTGAGTLATSFENGDTVDGVTLATGDEILLKDQSAGAENGIYVVAASGAPDRRADYDADVDIMGSVVRVREGTANADTVWLNTNDTLPTIDTTALTFAQFSSGGGMSDPMTTRGDIIIRDASNVTARLGIGTSGKVLSSDGTDISWQTPSSGFSNPMTTKGDLIVGDTGGSPIRKAVGTDTHVLTADSTATGGIKWAAAGGGGGGLVFIDAQTASSSATLDFTGIDGTYDVLLFQLVNVLPATDAVDLLVRMGTGGGPTYDTGTNYDWSHGYTYSGTPGTEGATNATAILIRGAVTNATMGAVGSVELYNPASTTLHKGLTYHTVSYVGAVGTTVNDTGGCRYRSTTAVTAIRFYFSSGNIASGTIRRYGIVNS